MTLAEARLYLSERIAEQIAPVFAREFLTGGDAWQDYDDLAGSIVNMATAVARRLHPDPKPRKRRRLTRDASRNP